MICLRSARTVIEIGKAMSDTSKGLEPVRIWTITHHIFCSTVILVMDYCFNREDPRAKERKEEIMECFKLLERSQEASTIATQGLKQLREILRRWQAKRDHQVSSDPPSPVLSNANTTVPQPRSLESHVQPRPQYNSATASSVRAEDAVPSASGAQEATGPYSHEQWFDLDDSLLESINFAVDLDSSEWEALFQNVEGNHPIY